MSAKVGVSELSLGRAAVRVKKHVDGDGDYPESLQESYARKEAEAAEAKRSVSSVARRLPTALEDPNKEAVERYKADLAAEMERAGAEASAFNQFHKVDGFARVTRHILKRVTPIPPLACKAIVIVCGLAWRKVRRVGSRVRPVGSFEITGEAFTELLGLKGRTRGNKMLRLLVYAGIVRVLGRGEYQYVPHVVFKDAVLTERFFDRVARGTVPRRIWLG